jgi:hypothetical protein
MKRASEGVEKQLLACTHCRKDTIARALAAAELENGKKCPLALASERRAA